MLLARNTAPDRLKAIGYIEQAIIVLEEHGSDDNGDEVMTTPLTHEPQPGDSKVLSLFCLPGEKGIPDG
jgi:hypothetical protein